ncbi:putative regulatory protein [Carbonactinospora thermoautotrophica]|uniref:Putative regulatory protein n=1 Tax=Carbonactinospora thermoautotrophica TaxID=1469144 RepID=A0A132MWM7_9ACTN|nr:putative regulatory protein [Carbonactinospora thermoautotrophica]
MRWHVTYYCIWRGLHRRYLLDDVQVVVTELFTNAVRHAEHRGQPITVVLDPRNGALRVEVHDPDPTLPTPNLDIDLDATCGRGLLLVETLAHRWGAVPLPDGGKVVFAEIEPCSRQAG